MIRIPLPKTKDSSLTRKGLVDEDTRVAVTADEDVE